MRNHKIVLTIVTVLFVTSCVQKSSTKTVVVQLTVDGLEAIQSVGIRGSAQPLSWEYDIALEPIIQDSLYTVTFSMITGYAFTEAKFTVNGQFELTNQDNRRIRFSESDTTIYEATFDVRNDTP